MQESLWNNMQKMSDKDVFNFLKGFTAKSVETKKHVTELYIKGFINYEEFIKRMKTAID